MTSGYLEQATLRHAVQADYRHRLGWFEVGAALGYGRSAYSRSDQADLIVDEVTFGGVLQWVWRGWRWIPPSAGLEVGGSWVWQTA